MLCICPEDGLGIAEQCVRYDNGPLGLPLVL